MPPPDPDLLISLVMSFFILGAIPITVLGGMLISRSNLKLRLMEQRKMLEAYTELMKERLDVIKTAIAVGYEQEDLVDLDLQLEELIGADEMRALINPKAPAVPAAPVVPAGQPRLVDADIAAEVERLQQKREERAAIKQTRLRK